ncbi:arsenate reductase (thioredoxin) [Alicyclobacillus sp. SO9]|uniref:arsenate reductase (thioredoxin) n=1 Tax=Alicyclobacillus sp. SO9 TaxID=2665646 RepID=UPI0018E78BF8|nr:arsenate reductase (thioredoxin) [Alicyclobacillus sp. SO9]QQE76948.1 arsenate reductase (thioredoxin) [Alicyclobacillus sp. SO9]
MTNEHGQKPLVYFLCTGNSCRSQMAEGWARTLGQDKVEVYSAGIEAHGLNPRAVRAMRERNVDISQHTSKEIDRELLNRVDYAITLCGDANDRCPTTPAHVNRMHWGFEDPARATGTEEEIQEKFREVRDAIYTKVDEFLKSLQTN